MRVLATVLMLGALGCQEYELKNTGDPVADGTDTDPPVVDLEDTDPPGDTDPDPVTPDEVIDIYEVVADPPVDILFALDKSCSMVEEGRNLSRAFDDFIAEIDSVSAGWQIGVSVKDNGCFEEGVITAQTPDYEEVFDDAVTGLNIFGNDLEEELLELAAASLAKTGSNQCNRDFLRPGAVLHMILISDEPEQSGVDWHDWLTEYYSYVANPAHVVVSGVIDQNDDCGTLGTGYIEAANATGGMLLDVCDSDWGQFATQLGAATAALVKTFALSGVPDESTIVVLVDGVPYPSWTYDPVRNVIVFDDVFPPGTTVEIRWYPETTP